MSDACVANVAMYRRATKLKVQCCMCKRVRVGDEWLSPVNRITLDDKISHGYCPTCAAQAFAQIAQATEGKRKAQ